MLAAITNSYPSSTTQWSVQAVVVLTGTGAVTVTPWVLCSQ
jgi:hypothetical protein